jgi:hypothetical protein
MNSRRNALSLAAVLAATVLTGGAAILGVTHPPSPQPSVAPIVQTVQPAAPPEGGD